ncbi:hypothetical protein CCM_03803 [Cordyceps militaris CM01]|uniref:Uncharacterized protein n=1 Tax=Cordyceps militaris (strain CM01) TaxID=983644 RepID=G3JGR6_CORMM|nr:uncharacterized protein CCM_03803 [Cordyceps militaris CM01]EGX92430.1 hypothetical protein CCM_03803 [Cordyceps militaris CM01]
MLRHSNFKLQSRHSYRGTKSLPVRSGAVRLQSSDEEATMMRSVVVRRAACTVSGLGGGEEEKEETLASCKLGIDYV